MLICKDIFTIIREDVVGALPTNNRKYQLSLVQERHREIARLIVSGFTNKGIAEQLNITPQMVSYTRNSHLVQEIMEDLGEARDEEVKSISIRIREMAPKALDLIEGSLKGSIEGSDVPLMQRLRDAHNILDRDGYKPITKVDSQHTSLTLTGEDIIKIKERAAELALQSKNLVEVEEAEVIDIGVKNGNITSDSGEEHSSSDGADSISSGLKESVDETNDNLHRQVSQVN